MIVVQRRPLDSLVRHPDNPRLGDVDSIKESIRVNGWWGVVVTQKSTGYILVGNHRTDAARELLAGNFPRHEDQSDKDYEHEVARWRAELASLPVHVYDCDDETARRVLLADNRTSDIATYDDPKLLRLTAQIVDPAAAMQVLADPTANADQVAEALRLIARQPKRGSMRGTGYKEKDVEQLAIAMEGGEAQVWGSMGDSIEEREVWATTDARQIVFIMKVDVYERVIPLLTRIGDELGLETNVEVFLHLLDQWAAEHPEPVAVTS